MQYKTIILNLLQQNPTIHERLRQERKLLATVETAAEELKASHEALIEQLTEAHPKENQRIISSQAFEMAMKEMQERLLPESPSEQTAMDMLDEAMATVTSRSPRG